MNSDFNHRSYELHQKHFSENFDQQTLNSWKQKDTVDYWRHENMYKTLLPLISNYPDASWLTVGDGRYGTDANYLITNGLKNVVASDISDTLLKIAKQDNFISEYKVENAEKMSFEDNSFDFVLCKEAYHHFPRPTIALYEMIRIARKAVVLIEPLDKNINFSKETFFVKSLRSITNSILLSLKGINKYENFEDVGNYIFTTSEREINKIAIGLNLKKTYFKHQNDFYLKGAESEKMIENGPVRKAISKKINLYNLMSKIGLIQYGLLISIIPKIDLEENCTRSLMKNQFDEYLLPVNPFV